MIYKRHVDDARFDVIRGHEFKSLKERLVTVRHLLEKDPEVSPKKRTELIQAVLSEDNFQLFPPPDENNRSGKTWWSTLTGYLPWSKETDGESLRADVKKKTGRISDSIFLLQLKGVDDKELEAPIKAAADLACIQLSSLIDTTVKKMTHAVLRMQQDECKRLVRVDMETEERKVLDGKLADFIQVINQVFHERRPS